MSIKNTAVILAPCCVIVKGKNNSCIYDLQRNGVYRFPNKFLTVFQKVSDREIWNVLTNISTPQEKKFIEALWKNQLCVATSQSYFFRPLGTECHTERLCENAIVDRGEESTYSMEKVAEKLSLVSCAAVSLRYFYPVKLELIESEVMAFGDSTARSIDIHCNYLSELTLTDLKEFKKRNGRVCSLVFYSGVEEKIINIGSNLCVQFKKIPMNINSMCGCVSEKKMRAQTQLYIESKNYNNCLYRKIYIDERGEIRNCPGMSRCYGFIDDDRLQLDSILNSSEFKKCWFLTKDMVEECQDCEFRYACLDCRSFLQKPGNVYSKPLKCQYNP